MVDAVQRFAGSQLWTIFDSPVSTPAATKIDAALADWEISVVHCGEPRVPATTKALDWEDGRHLGFSQWFMTLQHGDVILTGFPGQCRRLTHGDEFSCRVWGNAELKTPVIPTTKLASQMINWA
ncbi:MULTISPECIES: fumarylacetoacetate hydrolase family protein [unclassified Arthrobacter]|uniref:fumarylacetoacetate hydrolase family protein n=1 Tax=unclassified Arthrobacter TaxID=235627 RepID=UPI0015E273A3|nr:MULTISPECIES: hypothetical protein [unclassified Arthrobacter]